MDRIINNETATVVTTFSASFGILLENPILISIAFISGFIGIWNAVAMLDKDDKLGRNIETYDAIFKGAFVGTLSAPLLTLALIVFVDPLLNKYFGISIEDTKQVFLYLLYSGIGLFLGRKVGFFVLNYKPKWSKNDRDF